MLLREAVALELGDMWQCGESQDNQQFENTPPMRELAVLPPRSTLVVSEEDEVAPRAPKLYVDGGRGS